MRGWLIGLGIVVLIGVGFLFKGPSPAIVVAPEHVFDLGPLEVTNTMFSSWIVVVLLVVVAYIAGRGLSLVPSGFSGAVEGIVVAFYDIVVGVVGEAGARRFFPLVGTIFFFVLISNYFGLLPFNNIVGVPEEGHGDPQVVFQQSSLFGFDVAMIPLSPTECDAAECPGAHGAEGAHVDVEPIHLDDGEFTGVLAPLFRSVMTDLNAPAAIALFSFVFVEFWGLQTLGIRYLLKFFNPSRLLKGNPMGLIDIFVGFLEFLSEWIRIVSFTFRLFGNIFAGEVLLLMMAFIVPFVLVDVFLALELFVGLIQAFVFAMLTLVFAQQAIASHGDDHAEQPGAEQGSAEQAAA